MNLNPSAHALQTLVGRERELAQVVAHQARPGQIVTLCGPPGIGKTHLARAASEQALRAGLVRQRAWVDLSGCVLARDCVSRILQALQLQFPAHEEERESLVGRWLRRADDLLLVLDQAHQATEALTGLVAQWSSQAMQARLLITSYQPLGVQAEHVLDCEPLPGPDAQDPPEAQRRSPAAQLFLRALPEPWRAPLSTPEQLPYVREVVHAMEGLPLALILVAARHEVLTPEQILTRLPERFKLLREPEGVWRAHSSLWQALDASWQLLAPWAQEALSQLSILPAGFDLESAQAIVRLSDPSVEVLDALHALVRPRLIQRAQGQRMSALECVRQMGLERLKAQACREVALTQVYERAIAYFGDPQRWRVDAHAHNLSAFWALVEVEEYNLRELFAWALKAHQERPSAKTASALLALAPAWGGLLSRRDDRRACAQVHAQIIEAVEAHAPALIGTEAFVRCLELRGITGRWRADLERALALARSQGLGLLEAILLGNLSELEHERGDEPQALTLAQASLQLYERHGSPWRQAQAQAWLGFLLMDSQRERAIALLTATRQTFAQVGDSMWLTRVTTNLGSLALEEGRLDQARPLLEDAYALSLETGNLRQQGLTRGLLGVWAHLQGRLRAAREHYEEAIARCDLMGSDLGALYRGYVGLMELAQGQPASALRALVEAIAQTPAHEEIYGVAWALGESMARQQLGSWVELEGLARRVAGCPSHASRAMELALRAVRAGQAGAWGEVARLERELSAQPLDLARLLVPALERWRLSARQVEGWQLSAEGAWFKAPGQEQATSLGRRRTIMKVLCALLEHRIESPGERLTLEELAQAGWPGERVKREMMQNRVYVAISTLRALGLGPLLISSEGGYMLDPQAPLTRVP